MLISTKKEKGIFKKYWFLMIVKEVIFKLMENGFTTVKLEMVQRVKYFLKSGKNVEIKECISLTKLENF